MNIRPIDYVVEKLFGVGWYSKSTKAHIALVACTLSGGRGIFLAFHDGIVYACASGGE